jgi:hypothetical protein
MSMSREAEDLKSKVTCRRRADWMNGGLGTRRSQSQRRRREENRREDEDKTRETKKKK